MIFLINAKVIIINNNNVLKLLIKVIKYINFKYKIIRIINKIYFIKDFRKECVKNNIININNKLIKIIK